MTKIWYQIHFPSQAIQQCVFKLLIVDVINIKSFPWSFYWAMANQKKGKRKEGNTKIWISWEWKKPFRYKKKTFFIIFNASEALICLFNSKGIQSFHEHCRKEGIAKRFEKEMWIITWAFSKHRNNLLSVGKRIQIENCWRRKMENNTAL